jgi:hypothetical protein
MLDLRRRPATPRWRLLKSCPLPVTALLARHADHPEPNHPLFEAILRSVGQLPIRYVNIDALQLYVTISIILAAELHHFVAPIHMCVDEVAHSLSSISA